MRALLLAAASLLAASAAAAAEPGALLEAEFEGKNFAGFSSGGEAKQALKEKLYDELERKLLAYGFAKSETGNILIGAKFQEMAADEKKVDISEGGKVKRVLVYDLAGRASVRIGPAEVQKLFNTLVELQPASENEVTRFRASLKLFTALNPPANHVDRLRDKLKRAWLEQAKASVSSALGNRALPADAFARAFADVYPTVKAYREETGDAEGTAQLGAIVEALGKKYFTATAIDSSRAPGIAAAIEAIGGQAAGEFPDLAGKLKGVVEFRWREQINEMSQGEATPLNRLKIEVDEFIRQFGGSKFAAEAQRRLEARLVRYLGLTETAAGAELAAYTDEYLDFSKRFPSSASQAEVRGAFVGRCAKVLPGLEAKNDDEYARYTKCWEACFEAAKGRPEYDRLKTAQAAFLAGNKSRDERDLLGGLGFVLYWDRAAAEFRFGGPKGSFPGQGKAADMWDSGQESEKCFCRASPDDLCRAIRFSGEYYEAAAKFGPKGLYEVELCSFEMPQSKRAFLYQSLRDRHKPLHKKAESEKFLNGLSGDDLEFAPTGGKRHRVVIGAAGDRGSVRFYMPGLAPSEERKAGTAAEEKRPARAWKKGDCVRWDCDGECRYEGKIKDKKGPRWLVTVKKAPRSLELDMNVPKDGDELQGCEE